MRYVWIGGRAYLWRDLLKQRRDQREAAKKKQLVLFDLKEDARPASQRNADGRYCEPTLFETTGRTSCDTAPVAQVREPRSTKA
jgi:hypothetical protein